ncbi:response regulator transcription factor [Flavitalea sp. BT771]|uniref:response regulator transcription factor n=1 Tax=Flavitalea sp. BT771 TaxID=3063329 RepID=UPI0026E1D326|nr:response regulator transcription factor [Flavitalea sp. BT771]MDO6435689.1 response regulator transcription factor [Flavitalea sp. BT771]MDV6224590.1 response regulator transcription factor [Flavitalea sp. BT771]
MQYKILLMEDEQDLGGLISRYLEAHNFSVVWCLDAKSALVQLIVEKAVFDVLLIDVSMPEINGFEFTAKILALGVHTPFLFVTARNEKVDRLHGLKLGADDYIVKPFDIDELVLRIQNIIRRNRTGQPAPAATSRLELGDVRFFKDTLTLLVGNNAPIELTSREASLLEILLGSENRIIKREELLSKVWGEYEAFGGRSVDVFISRLRKYLSPSMNVSIDNVYGVGFILKVR